MKPPHSISELIAQYLYITILEKSSLKEADVASISRSNITYGLWAKSLFASRYALMYAEKLLTRAEFNYRC